MAITFAIILSGMVFAAEPTGNEGFAESFTIILREGLEAILVIAAIIAYLVAAKHKDKVKTVYLWSGLAVVVSFFTAFIIDIFFSATDTPKEILEGITMLIASVVLLYVTNWLLGKIESKKWNNYIKGKVDDALTKNSSFALGLVSFLAVYREGFETVLFFKALTAGTMDLSGILLGMILGFVALAILFMLIIKLEQKLPLNLVFGATSILLFVLSVKFAGKGIHELQEAHIIPETVIMIPKIADLGIYPTIETISVQIIALIIGAALVYIHFAKKEKINISSN